MRRLAYVCADAGVPVFGSKGCSVHVQEFVRACRQDGLDVEVFAARRGGCAPADLQDVHVHELDPGSRGGQASPDDAVRHRELAALARNRVIQQQLTDRGPFDAIYERHALWSCAAMEQARATGVPGVLEVNAPLLQEQQTHRALRQPDVASRVMRRAFAAADLLLPVSEMLARWLVSEGVAHSRVHVVPNAVDPVRFAGPTVAALPAAPGLITIGFLGSLKPWHGLEILADAFVHLRRRGMACRLLIVGDGPLRTALAEKLASAGCADAVFWAGAVPPAAVPAWLASMDIGVAPYTDAEGCYFSPLKAFEYMAAGVPMVASAVGQVPALVRHGLTGWLVDPGRPDALADALAAMGADRDGRLRVGAAARAYVSRHHTWRATVQRVRGLVQASAPRAARRQPRASKEEPGHAAAAPR